MPETPGTGAASQQSPAPQLGPGKPPAWIWLVIGVLGTAAILGVPYFTLPYQQVERTTALWLGGLIVIGLMAAAVRIFGRVKLWQAAAAPVAGFLLVACSRIAADVAVDPTSHNLWPLEIGVLLFAGGVAALIGAFVGGFAGRFIGKK